MKTNHVGGDDLYGLLPKTLSLVNTFSVTRLITNHTVVMRFI